MKNVIIGKNSIISNNLKRILSNVEIISARDEKLEKKIRKINKSVRNKKKINIIFNNFYPSNKISSVNEKDYLDFINLSLLVTIKVLNNFEKSKINKIIYSSSASIYGIDLERLNDHSNRKFSSSFKFLNENIIYNYSKKNNIDFKILRIFNMYSGLNDRFSVLGKIFESKKKNKVINIFNKGESLRDFIHVSDVVKIIKIMLNKNSKNQIYDVGTGYGIKIKDLLNYIKFPKKLIKYKNKKDLVGNSISNNSNILSDVGYSKFIQIDNYLKKNLKISKKQNLKKYKFKNISNQKINLNEYIIYGAGNVGKQVYEQLINSKEKVSYFVDDNINYQGKYYNGVKIISLKELEKVYIEEELGSIIISIANLEKNKLNKIKTRLKKLSSNVLYLPTKKELISDKINLNDALSLGLEGIIGRREIKLNKKNITIKNKTILVTGAGGSIGSELCRQLEFLKVKRIIALDNSEIALFNLKKKQLKKIKYILGDIKEQNKICKIIKNNKIDHIFHAAAYKHVNILENNIGSAINNNILGTLIMVENALKYKCSFTLISTDKAVNPSSVLGLTKRIAEIITIYKRKFSKKNKINIVRFGNVFGSIGSAVPTFIEQINNNKIITITNKNAKRYFMTIKEACALVIGTINLNIINKSFVLNMGKQIKIIDIINYLIKLKKINNPDYKYKIKETGLKKGEKISEELFGKYEKIKKINKNISIIKENSYKDEKVESLISNIKKFQNKEQSTNSLNLIKSFIKKEIQS